MDLFFYHDVTEFHEVALTPPCFPSRNITKNSKTYSSPMRDVFIEQPLRQNRGFISSPLSGKNTITFCNIWAIYARKQGGFTVQELESKLIPGQLPVKNFWFQHFFQFCGYRSQRTFQKNFHSNFQVWLLFLVQRLLFSKK